MKIAIIIPALNEESTIAKVVQDFSSELPEAGIYVFDNNSSDKTPINAVAAGANVMIVKQWGKGNVIRCALKKINADIYIMIDGDDTYLADEVQRLMTPILKEQCDMVIGNRFGFNSEGFSKLHIIGNKIIILCMRFCFPHRINDLLSGYRVFTSEVAKDLDLKSKGFTIETEMTIKALEQGFRILEIPIRYRKRLGDSTSKLRSFHDARLIVTAIIRLFWSFRRIEFCFLIVIVFSALLSGYI